MAAVVGVAGLVLAGCGATGSAHRPRPSATPRATATPQATATPAPVTSTALNCHHLPPTRYRLAVADKGTFQFQVPAAPAAPKDVWASYNGKWVMPANWESFIPHVPVVNDSNGAVSNCTAAVWAYGLLRELFLNDWASVHDDPSLLQASGPSTWYGLSELRLLDHGGHQQGAGVWPSRLILVSAAGGYAQDMGVKADWAFIATFPAGVVLNITANGAIVSKQTSKAGGAVLPGSYASNYHPAMHPAGWPYGGLWLTQEQFACNADTTLSQLCATVGVS